MEVFEIIGLLIAGAAGLINYVQNRRRRELAEDGSLEEGDEDFIPFPEDILLETDEALESMGRESASGEVIRGEATRRETADSIPMGSEDASPFEEMIPQGGAREGRWAQMQERVEAYTQAPFGQPVEESIESREDTRRESTRTRKPTSLSTPMMIRRPKKTSSSRLTSKKRARQAIIDAEVFAPPISKRQKGPFTPLSRPV